MNFDQPLPSAPETEAAILGSVMLDSSLIETAMALTKPHDYDVPAHRKIFEAQIALFEKGSLIAPHLVIEELRRTKQLAAVGGMSFVSSLTTGVPHTTSIEHYARIVREKAAYRAIIRTAMKTIEEAYAEEDESEAVAERAANAMVAIERFGAAKSDFRSYAEIAEEARGHYEQLFKGVSEAIPTGYAALDKVTRGGIYPGEVRVIMAKTGDGKSAWAIGAARTQGRLGIPVAFISLEMSDLENFVRAHSAVSGVAAWKIQAGIWSPDYKRLTGSLPEMATLPIYSASSSRMADVYEMRRQVRELFVKHKIRVLYVDYLQLAEVILEKKTTTRALEISTITRMLKLLAKELGIGVVELSQPSQEGAKSGKVKTVHNRESTAIGNDADIVIVIDMPEDRENMTEWECSMRIDKHRNGPKVSIPYWYDGQTLTFSDEPLTPRSMAQVVTDYRNLDFNAE